MKNSSKKSTFASEKSISKNKKEKTAGSKTPVLLEGFWFVEKLAHFNREVIPERRIYSKGSGAFGTFTVTNDISNFTKAKLFSDIGKKTDIFVRFSTASGERGIADVERDIRGFAVKFYTEEGNWDLVGNNTPIYFLKDPYKFPDLIKAIERDPKANLRNANHNWDFWTLLPETLHQITITMSERGIPKSYRHMNGYGSHTFSFFNEKGERFWVKFHLKTGQGIQNLTDKEAEIITGKDGESHQRDLFNAIEEGNYPKWYLKVQIMPNENANCYRFDPFDLTKVWPHADYPLMDVGVLELNKNPDNYFVDVEQASFNPANIIPGIGFSPDRMLQGRLFSYGDAQRYRLGVNHYQIPVNKPKCPIHNFHKDGAMRIDDEGSTIHYEPNSYGQWSKNNECLESSFELDGYGFASHYNHREEEDDDDNYSQPGNLFRMMTSKQKKILFENTARHIIKAEKSIQMRHIHNCYKADPNYGKGLAKILNISLKELGIKEPKSMLNNK